MKHLPVAPIVEGHGEVDALPVLIRRIAVELLDAQPVVSHPWRVPKGRMTRGSDLARAVTGSSLRVPSTAHVLVVVDADEDHPQQLRDVVRATAGREVSCVVATMEYEAWLLAGWVSPGWDPARCESVRDAKGRLSELIGRSDNEVRDQAALTAQFDLAQAQARSPSLTSLIDVLSSLRVD